jgi:signal transduction histidine kinase/CheY-like chemotaxis protein/uncharacterized protein YigA (DUF484 family)
MSTARSLLMRHGVAGATVALATVTKVALDPALGDHSPFLLFFGAVMVSAWFGGLAPALLATVASALVAAYFFFPPDYSFAIAGHGDRIRIVAFVFEATLISLLGGALHSARRRAEESERSLQADVAERTRLYHESENRRRAAEGLAELGRLLSQSLDFDAVVSQIVESVRTLLGVKAALLFTYEPRSGDLVALAGSGDVRARLEPPVVFPKGTNVVGFAVQERRPIFSPDALADPRFPADPAAHTLLDASPDRTILALPLLVQDRVVGAVSLRDITGRVFSTEEVRLAQAFADQAALALENARLYVQAGRRREEAEALAHAARTLTETLDVSAVAARIVASIQQILRVHTAGFRLLQPDRTLLALGPPGGAPGYAPPGHIAPSGHGTAGHVIASGAPFQSPDVLIDPSIMLTDDVRQRILAAGTHAFLSVPLRPHGTLIGVLTVGDAAGRVFTAAEIGLLQAFADQAALAIDNAQLFERVQRAYDELSHAHQQLVRGETLRAVGELAAGVAHHLNNLLAVILGRIQITLRRSQAPELQRDLRPAEQATLDGAEVVKRLSRFSRGHPEPTIVPVDLNELVEDVVELTRPRWQNELAARGVRVETILELGSVPMVAADPPSVREVLVNLILNAVDALPSGGSIVLRTWASTEGIHCSVRDNGIGMSAEIRRRVLEPFFTTKGVKSTGLGLSVTYGIMQRHGGELTIDTEEGAGTTVTFLLPVAKRRPRPSASAPAPAVAPLHVLLIDDEANVRSVIADMLGEDGHRVTQVSGGPEALALLARAGRVDLVLTDLGMLGMNGWEVAHAVKALYPSTVVGLVTGWDEGLGPKPVEPAQVDLVVRKPVTQATLRDAIAQARALVSARS